MSNTPSRAEIEALVKRHGATSYRNRADTQHPAYGFTEDGLNGLIDEVLAKWGQPAQAAEPVAWLDPWTGTKVTTDYDAYGKHGIPLYTAPQPVAREPLTDEMVLAALRVMSPATFKHGLHPLEKDGPMIRQRMEIETKLVRKMLDAAHGIKGGQHG